MDVLSSPFCFKKEFVMFSHKMLQENNQRQRLRFYSRTKILRWSWAQMLFLIFGRRLENLESYF